MKGGKEKVWKDWKKGRSKGKKGKGKNMGFNFSRHCLTVYNNLIFHTKCWPTQSATALLGAHGRDLGNESAKKDD